VTLLYALTKPREWVTALWQWLAAQLREQPSCLSNFMGLPILPVLGRHLAVLPGGGRHKHGLDQAVLLGGGRHSFWVCCAELSEEVDTVTGLAGLAGLGCM